MIFTSEWLHYLINIDLQIKPYIPYYLGNRNIELEIGLIKFSNGGWKMDSPFYLFYYEVGLLSECQWSVDQSWMSL